jgi:hypothetical protein
VDGGLFPAPSASDFIERMASMASVHKAMLFLAVFLAVAINGCYTQSDKSKKSEHDREGGERHGTEGKEGEESGPKLALNQSYDHVRNGARLILAYDEKTNSFSGTVENTTDKTLKQVRVEVHLSNGKELGPTTPTDLDPGKKTDVKLVATSKDFDWWTAHPEVGIGEHGGGGHGDGKGG